MRQYVQLRRMRTIHTPETPWHYTFQVSSLQLLHHQAPQAALLILAVSPFFDDTVGLLAMVCSMAQPSRWLRCTLPDEGDGVAAAAVTAARVEATSSMLWAGVVFLSCLLAFLVNLSTFLVIERTSPISYQVMAGS